MNEPESIDLLAIVKYLWLVIAGVFAYVFKEHIAEDKKRADELAEVRETYATRGDISYLHEKIDANHKQIMELLLRD